MGKYDLKDIEKVAKGIYHISSVLKDHSHKYIYNEEIARQYSLVEYLHNNAEELNCLFAN